MVIIPSTNTRDASKWVQMHFPETQFILWHHGNNIHVEKKKSEVSVLRREKGLNLYYMYVLYKSNNDKKYRYEVLSH